MGEERETRPRSSSSVQLKAKNRKLYCPLHIERVDDEKEGKNGKKKKEVDHADRWSPNYFNTIF
jgi:hypothetical protein